MELNTVWEERLKRIFATKPKSDEELFLDIVSMFIYHQEDDNISTLYKEVGLEKFIRLLGLLGGTSIEIPSQDHLRDSMLTALCFYYKDIKNKSWEEIKAILPFNGLNTVSYGIAIAKLEKDIAEKVRNNFKDIDEDNINEITKYI